MDFLPGIEGREGAEGVPVDLKGGGVVLVDRRLAILPADSKRLWKRSSSSVCF